MLSTAEDVASERSVIWGRENTDERVYVSMYMFAIEDGYFCPPILSIVSVPLFKDKTGHCSLDHGKF